MAVIPVANLYYLLCYAWDEFAPRQMDRYAAEDFPDTFHLFSRQLIVGVRALHRQGFETGYIPLEESTSNPRGRILMAPSIRTRAMSPKKVYCAFDEMSADILSNQILKATLRRLTGEETLQGPLRRELRQTMGLLASVRDIELTRRVFHSVRVHQNNRLYSFLMTICHFLWERMEALEIRVPEPAFLEFSGALLLAGAPGQEAGSGTEAQVDIALADGSQLRMRGRALDAAAIVAAFMRRS